MQILTAQQLIAQFALLPHPEGGFFREIYKSSMVLPQDALSINFEGNRSACTAIYFLLERGDFSAFHRIKSDEIWHFYAGKSLLIYILQLDGQLVTIP